MRGDSGYAYLPAGQAEVEFGKYETRIQQLEKLNATLAAEIDRMRPVVEAAQVLSRSLRRHDSASWSGTEEALERAVTTFEADKKEPQA